MHKFSIINYLADLIKARSYLEIGVRQASHNFDKINIQHKVGVDPGLEGYNEATYQLTSDDFFASNYEFFDIIFIDGLHEHYQVLRDIINSLSILNPKGFIVCHDINPILKVRQLKLNDPIRQEYVRAEKAKNNPEYGLWNGDCWKAWVELRVLREDLKMHVVDTDFGCGIISRGSQKLLNTGNLDITYENLDNNRVEWLNLISTTKFKNLYSA